MSEATEFDIGSSVACSDGVCGKLARVVIDPVARAITHLVVEPEHRREGNRLIPVDQVESAGKQIRLKCTKDEFGGFDYADDTGAHTAFYFLADIYVLPRPFPLANVLSLGDVMIGVGGAYFIVAVMHGHREPGYWRGRIGQH